MNNSDKTLETAPKHSQWAQSTTDNAATTWFLGHGLAQGAVHHVVFLHVVILHLKSPHSSGAIATIHFMACALIKG